MASKAYKIIPIQSEFFCDIAVLREITFSHAYIRATIRLKKRSVALSSRRLITVDVSSEYVGKRRVMT